MSDILRDFDKKNEVLKVKIPKFATGSICNDVIFPTFDMFSEINEIVKDAMEFTKCIGELLRKNGVVPKLTEYTRNFETDNIFEARFGVSIDELDFTEHDKVFEDKIAKLELKLQRVLSQKKDHEDTIACYVEKTEELKQRIAELESGKTSELPFDPLECANYLINATYERKTSSLERAFAKVPDKVNSDRYTVDELEQIAEHLLVYCKHNKESE